MGARGGTGSPEAAGAVIAADRLDRLAGAQRPGARRLPLFQP
jgi:hypothetical protein